MLTKVRIAAVGLALLATFSLAVTARSRAQNPPTRSSKAELRHRLVELRGEVDLLQLEYDAIRENLRDALKKACEREYRVGAEAAEIQSALLEMRGTSIMSAASPYGIPDSADTTGAPLSGFAKDTSGAQPKKAWNVGDKAEADKLFDDLLRGNDAAAAAKAVERLTELELKGRKDGSRSAIDRARKDLLDKSRALNEKKLELAEAEKAHERETR